MIHAATRRRNDPPPRRPEADPGQALDALDNIPDALLCFDGQGLCTYANHQASQLCGRPREELLDEPVFRVLPEPVSRSLHDHVLGAYEWNCVRCEAPSGTGGTLSIQVDRQDEGFSVYVRDIRRPRGVRLEHAGHGAAPPP